MIPVTMRSVAADRQDIGKIEGLNVFAQITGQSVPLRQVAEVEIAWQPAKIIRRDHFILFAVSLSGFRYIPVIFFPP